MVNVDEHFVLSTYCTLRFAAAFYCFTLPCTQKMCINIGLRKIASFLFVHCIGIIQSNTMPWTICFAANGVFLIHKLNARCLPVIRDEEREREKERILNSVLTGTDAIAQLLKTKNMCAAICTLHIWQNAIRKHDITFICVHRHIFPSLKLAAAAAATKNVCRINRTSHRAQLEFVR